MAGNDFETLNLMSKEWEISDGILTKYRKRRFGNADSIKIPSGTKEIDSEAFEFAGADSIFIPKSVDIIRNCAFRDAGFERMYIENPNVYMEVGALYQMENLKEVYIAGARVDVVVTQLLDEDNVARSYLERYVGRDMEYHVDDDIISINAMAFYNCDTLEKVVLSNSVEEIGAYAFSNNGESTSLTEVVLSDSLRLIECGAFAYCNTIEQLEIPQSVEIIEKDAFEGWEDSQTIYVPMKFKQSKTLQRWRSGCCAQIIYY